MTADTPTARARPAIRDLSLADLRLALQAGWRDFRAAPLFGVFFSAVYVAAGLALVLLGAGTLTWTLMLSLGFPLVAPFAAVGLYEVSRCLERGTRPGWRAVLGVVVAERNSQVPWIGAIIVIYFLFWSFLAHMLFALFMGMSAMTNVSSSYDAFLTTNGLTMIAVELGLGAVLALLLFSLTVISLPLLLDRDVDFITAMGLSLSAMRANPQVLIVWAVVIAVLMLVAMLPAFLGLFLMLPVLGHATWHLYRRTVDWPDTLDAPRKKGGA